MSSENKDDDKADSDVSRFTLDGVVAEMVIEVEDNEQNSPSKSLKSDRLKDIKTAKSSALQKSSDTKENLDSTSISNNESKVKNSKCDEIESVDEPVNMTDEEPVMRDKISTSNESIDIPEKDKHIEDLEDPTEIEMVEDMEVEEKVSVKDLESKFKTQSVLEETKTLRSRQKIKSKSEIVGKEKDQLIHPKEEPKDEAVSSKLPTRSSVQKKNPNESSKIASLKRGNKATISSGEKDEVPGKKLKRSSEDNTPKKEKKSVSFNPVASKVTLSKRLSLRPIAPKGDLTQRPSPEEVKRAISITPTTPKVDSTTRQSLRNATPTDTPVRRSRRGRPSKNSPRPPPRPKLPSRGRGRPRTVVRPTPTTPKPIRSRTTPIPIRSKPFPSNSTPPSIKVTPSLRARSTSNKDTPVSKKTEPQPIAKAWNLVPDGKLESFPEIKKQVNQAAYRALRSLHHTLYGELQSRSLDAKALREEILKFKGFSFKKNSESHEKHVKILNRMSDSSINEIVKILNIKKKSIPSIMAFLMKPALQKPIEIIYCVEDPYQPSMQPIVKLPKMSLESSSFKSKENESKKTQQEKITKSLPVRTLSAESLSNESITSKRKRFPSTKLKFYDTDFNSVVPKKKISSTVEPPVPSAKPKTLIKKKTLASTLVKKAVIKAQSIKTASLKAAAVKKAKQQAIGSKNKLKRKKLPSSMVGKDKKPISSNLQVRRKALELALEIQETVDPSEFDVIEENNKFNLPSFEYETDIKEEVVTEDEAEDGVSERSTTEISDNITSNNVVTQEIEENRSENASSEVTLSSDEAKEAMETPQKKRFYKTTAIPLRSYPSIKTNITCGNYSALQRLHIVLFGSSDKAVNLKGNLLSFGGFPFKQGSEEWKQKRFLLSLLSKNTLKEYLDLLAIKYDASEDQHSLISKFMNFLAAPIENLPDDGEIRNESEIETDSADESPEEEEPTPLIVPVPKKVASQAAKKKINKKPAKKPAPVSKGPRGRRKVLMDEDQVRRLEADLAREQRILERERRLHEEEVKRLGLSSYKSALPKPLSINQNNTGLKQPLADNQTDSDLLNALLETVYQRRELKEAGAVVSIPNKGTHTRLGELANVKFLVVTANYNDLDVLHHLIYMSEATKTRVRKNILDFAGFNFAEDSPAYQDRMNFLTSLGYDISRRIAFLLGLCPYKSQIEQQDLNELIMYFLMSPCQSKQVPIRHLPNTFFGTEMPDELCALMEKHSEGIPIAPAQVAKPQTVSNTLQITISGNGPTPTPKAPPPQRAKKSFRSILPPSGRLGLTPSISTLQLATPKRPFVQPSILTPKQVQVSPKLAQPSPKPTSLANIRAQALARSIAQANAAASQNQQEFYIHQQTPDGHQKTFKLIKIPSNHPLNTVIKNQTPTPIASPSKPITIAPPVIGAPGLPPGLILLKNNSANAALSSIMQTVPLPIGQSAPATKLIAPAAVPVAVGVTPVAVNESAGYNLEEDSAPADIEHSLEEKDSTVPVECSFSDEDAEELHPLEKTSPPTDEELYSSIQDIIHSCASLEDITLRNVINQVSAEYPTFDLTPRHHYMKECVKRVIMGT